MATKNQDKQEQAPAQMPAQMPVQAPVQTPAQASAAHTPVFNIQRMYLKEASLEQPNAPAILLDREQPGVEIVLHVTTDPIGNQTDVYEVAVAATVQTKIKDKTLFLVECKQAGIFEIRNVPPEQLGPVLNITCPQIIYPYLRSNVSDMIVRGGFPPVHLAEINFHAMYDQQLAQQQASAKESATPAKTK
jgi:preprotein translocase subunit SecB